MNCCENWCRSRARPEFELPKPFYLRIERNSLDRCHSIRVVLEEGVPVEASLVTECGDPLMAKIVLGLKRVMLGVHRWHVRVQRSHADRVARGQTIRAEALNRIWIGRIAEERMHIGGNLIHNAGIRR
jgi:hypothetical protein